MIVFLYSVFYHPCLADIPTPKPIYSEIELGQPRLPPYAPNPYLWVFFVDVVVMCIIWMVTKKQSKTVTSELFR